MALTQILKYYTALPFDYLPLEFPADKANNILKENLGK